MTPASYDPQFDNTVFEYLGNNVYPINERYCLLDSSAKVLAGFFSPKPEIFAAPPIKQAPSSPFGFNHFVPWFRFPDGTERNAAVLAQYWGMPGVPRASALDYAKQDVAVPVEG